MPKKTEFEMEELRSIPKMSNPFAHNSSDMGHNVGSNLTVMYGNFPTQDAKYLILVHRPSGKRIKIHIPES